MMKQPRVEPLPESEWDDETRKLLEGLRRHGMIFNIFRTLGRHPKLLSRWLVFGSHTLAQSALPPRDREMVILRTGWDCGAEYEWGHHTSIGTKFGLTAADFKRIAEGPAAAGWEPFEAALLRGVDELLKDSFISDATWTVLSARYDTQQLFDFIFTVGQYKLVSMTLKTLGVQLEEGFEGFPQ